MKVNKVLVTQAKSGTKESETGFHSSKERYVLSNMRGRE